MCGIWAYLLHNKIDFEYNVIFNNFMNLSGRGPDSLNFEFYKNKYMTGFHRLSIMDTSYKGSQPFEYYDNETDIKYTCICNGEIYNAALIKRQFEKNEFNFMSSSDCEVLIPLYIKYKENMVNHLDGEFSIILIEECGDNIKYYIVRDRIGIRPLYIGKDKSNNFIFSSELKGMKDLAIESQQFKPGTYKTITYTDGQYNETSNTYYDINVYLNHPITFDYNTNSILLNIKNILIKTVTKRLISDRPVCALLSGGLDSSLVCSIASKILKGYGKKLYTFSIGIPGSTDNIYAQKVAEYIGSEHTVVTISQNDAIVALKKVIWATETYDITTIRASTGQYLISKYIADNTDFKVVLSGDGSDEVTSGYLENFLAPNVDELHKHAIKRIDEIHYYDVLRADRATSLHGLELRVPFLDVEFINYYLNIDPKLRQPDNNKCEKYLLRQAFKDDYLPEEVLWRQKEAFSDGISSQENSWHSIIKSVCDELITDEELETANIKYDYCTPKTKESYYFRHIFTELYGNSFNNIIPGFWMPKWSTTTDPSARSMEVYSKSNELPSNITIPFNQ